MVNPSSFIYLKKINMGKILPQEFNVQKVLKTDDKQPLGQPQHFMDLNGDQIAIPLSEKPIVSEKTHLYLSGETIPNEVLFYQNTNWLSNLNNYDDHVSFPLSEKQMISERKDHHPSSEPILNEVIFYQNVTWLVNHQD